MIMLKFNRIFPSMSLFLLAMAFTACQGTTAENMTPKGDTVEVEISKPVDRADTVIHSMDDEMLHGLDNETLLNTKI